MSISGFEQTALKLRQEDFDGIVKMLQKGEEYIDIADRFDITRQMVSFINIGRCWYNEDIDYPIRKKRKKEVSREIFCPECGKEKTRSANLCLDCAHIAQRKTERPEPLILAKEIIELGFEGTGRKYGVSGNAIKKWCKNYKIPHLKKDLVAWFEKQ